MSTIASTHYDLLCVAPEATAAELKVAYRRLMRTYHPDIAGAHGEKMTKLVNAAYTELSDEASRRSYDFSIRPQVFEEPAAEPTATAGPRHGATPTEPSQPTARPRRAGRPAPAAAAPEETPADEAEGKTFRYEGSNYRNWIITYSVLIAGIIGSLVVMNIEWITPTVPLSSWRIIPSLLVPAVLFVLFSRKPRVKTGIFVWVCALILPAGAMGIWPFAAIAHELALSVLISMTVIVPLVYISRAVWGHLRTYRWARKTLKERGEL